MKIDPKKTLPQLSDSALHHSPIHSGKSDSELMVEVAARSESALATLHSRYSPILSTVIQRVLNNAAEVDDVLQVVFLHLWNHASTYSEKKGQFIGWLITIARRRSLDRVRQRSAYQRATTRFEESNIHSGEFQQSSWSVDREVRDHELQVLVAHHLQFLPWQQSEVVKLTFFSGLSQREIAARLSVPLGTVKTRFELGLNKLGRSGLYQQAA